MLAPSCEACICNVLLTRLTLSVVMEISHGISVLKHTRLSELIHWENGHPEPLNGLVNAVARLEVSRYNQGLPLYDRVCMECVDNNSYEAKSCPEVVLYSFCHMGNSRVIMTIKGQQKETRLVLRMQKSLRKFGHDTTSISRTRCRVRGLLFLI